MGMRRIAYVHIVYLTYRKHDREKHIQVHLFFSWDPQKSMSKAKNYSILGLGFASLHNHAEVVWFTSSLRVEVVADVKPVGRGYQLVPEGRGLS